jgi:hypothetical protein
LLAATGRHQKVEVDLTSGVAQYGIGNSFAHIRGRRFLVVLKVNAIVAFKTVHRRAKFQGSPRNTSICFYLAPTKLFNPFRILINGHDLMLEKQHCQELFGLESASLVVDPDRNATLGFVP